MDRILQKPALFEWRRIHSALDGSSSQSPTNASSEVGANPLRSQRWQTSFLFSALLLAATALAFFTHPRLPSSSLFTLLCSLSFFALLIFLPPFSSRPAVRIPLLGAVFIVISALLASFSALFSTDVLFFFLCSIVVGELVSFLFKRISLSFLFVAGACSALAFGVDFFHPLNPAGALIGTGLALFLLTGSRLADDAIPHRHPVADRLDATLTRFSEALRTLLFWVLQGLGILQETESS